METATFAPRPVNKVIKFILTFIPDDEKNKVLIAELSDYLHKELVYKAPECLMSDECWVPFLVILQNNIPDLDEDWKMRIFKIVNDEEDIRHHFDSS